MLRTRVITAAALIAALLTALFLLDRLYFQALVALIVAAAGFEGARLCAVAGRLPAIAYGALCALAYFV
ncbi:MAG: phosphatidate cytidylyltransferase, partial [Burkholderiales bacterium]